MTTTSRPGRPRRWLAVACTLVLATGAGVLVRPPAALAYVTINGAGSTWSQNAVDSWRRNVAQFGMTVNYAGTGSSDGRNQFRSGTVDWAASDIPYGIKDGNNLDLPPTQAHPFAYMPVTAGGTTFMYNLKIGNQRVTNLRLSGTTIARIFTGGITMWNDAAIKEDNPGLRSRLPAIRIVPVVRSEGSGSTAQLTQWMVGTQRSIWNAYCAAARRNPCTQTSVYPIVPGRGMVAQAGDLGVAGYVAQPQANGAIGYVQYSYAIQAGFPVVKMLNNGGYYTEPTAGHVAVSLLKARINQNKNDPNVYLTQDLSQVYTNTDPRTYPLSGYSYMILPVSLNAPMTTAKGETLADFGKYALCQGQTQVNALGYSALPINLVQAGFDQLRKIPGAKVGNIVIRSCNNPTFSTDGTNTLAKTDPKPPDCDKKGPTQCATGTAGAKNQETPVNNGTGGPGGGGPGGGNTGGPSTNPSGTPDPGSNPIAQQGACDPDTQDCGQAGGNTGDPNVFGQPVSAEAGLGGGFRIVLMVLAGVLLLALGLGPPLIAQAGARRRQRRSDDFTMPGGPA
ncbi:phosphate ABC transporter substrate-binding protein PstS [Phytohabitans sp. ZYX-F-186]|uniref:Phosphate ABC transporter substrate-binding protein PstS n=1 Tax=Phytohabitans maris TaxID=3071409 RepID=A0ABU0ZW29_9ACTN|nr:phosphate ABC transporter substrate-binding protein PstS [Phytohabitans sp. ZYX-F-186]MDQ7911138.1 phosphate ABC transporter substrate-binding protein PstS [Phytohabitans sp. ZYX-F-186]